MTCFSYNNRILITQVNRTFEKNFKNQENASSFCVLMASSSNLIEKKIIDECLCGMCEIVYLHTAFRALASTLTSY